MAGLLCAALSARRLALLLMELGAGRFDGLQLLKGLSSRYPRLPVLVLSDAPADCFALRTMRAGAAGFLEKDSEPEQLLTAIRCALNGQRYLTPALSNSIIDAHLAEDDREPLHEVLSSRELQVFLRLAAGAKLTRIADELGLSVKAVDTHRARIFRKMGMKTRESLARYAFEHGLIPCRRLSAGSRATSSP